MPVPKKQKSLSEQEVYQKISSWCAYQERSHSEVRHKLYGYKLKNDLIDEIIFRLIQDNFLNEERFAKAYAGGKFRIKKWGKIKIRLGLKEKDVSENCIKLAMNEIEPDDYLETIQTLIEKKKNELYKESNEFVRNRKIAEYMIRKGFEPELVWEEIKSDV